MSSRIDKLRNIFEELAKTGSPDALIAAIDDDTVLRNAIPQWAPFGGEYRGKAGFLEYLRRVDTVLDMYNLRALDYFETGDKAVVLGDEMLRIKATGEEFFSEWCTVFTFREDRIASVFVLEDHSPLCVYLSKQS